MFSPTPTGYEPSLFGVHGTSCICDMCTNNECENCRCYKNIGCDTYRISDAKDLYESDGMDAVVEKYGVESSTYTLYFENQKIYSSYNEIDPNNIHYNFGIRVSDNSIIIDFYYNNKEIGSIDTGIEYTSFSDFMNLEEDFRSKGFKDYVKVEKTTKKELVEI